MSLQPSDHNEEQSLIRKYKKTGDLEVLGALYKKYIHLVYGVCLKYFKNREESQDAVMQIFEKIIENLKTNEVTNFKSWLYVVTKNFCLMRLRSTQHKLSAQSKDITEHVVENVLVMHHNDEDNKLEDDLTKLETCIEQLQMEQKTCVQLFYLEKKSYREIVESTSFEMKKVKSYIQNGKRNLKICIENHR